MREANMGRRARGGTSFTWKPSSFQDVVRILNSPGAILDAAARAVSIVGALECPAPTWDPDGTYRVGVSGGKLIIQKFQGGNWVTAPQEKPASA